MDCQKHYNTNDNQRRKPFEVWGLGEISLLRKHVAPDEFTSFLTLPLVSLFSILTYKLGVLNPAKNHNNFTFIIFAENPESLLELVFLQFILYEDKKQVY